jgi:hypothetical protein
MDMYARKAANHPMSEIAAFVADLKSVFGEQEIDEGSEWVDSGPTVPS